ncbi:MAG: PepSY domain-containing protein [Hyphomicrobium sp.]
MIVSNAKIALAALLVVWSCASTPAVAADDRDDHVERYDDATVVERAYTADDVAIALREQGFETWDDIDWDDGVWKIDDARRVDGREYDLKLDPVTLAVVWSDRD